MFILTMKLEIMDKVLPYAFFNKLQADKVYIICNFLSVAERGKYVNYACHFWHFVCYYP